MKDEIIKLYKESLRCGHPDCNKKYYAKRNNN